MKVAAQFDGDRPWRSRETVLARNAKGQLSENTHTPHCRGIHYKLIVDRALELGAGVRN